MNSDINAKKKDIAEIAKKYGLDMVVLFGSQATGALHSKSDIDIAVINMNDSDRFKVYGDFCALLKREDIEIVNISNASPTLMYSVVRDGVLIYEKKESDFFRWKIYAMWIWRDTKWLRDLRDKKLIEWAKTT